jgi:hypothetical protein
MEQFVKTLESLPFEEAREAAVEVAKDFYKQSRTINQKTARMNIVRDLENAPNKAEIIRISYMQLLASEGFGNIGSAFRKKHDNI